MRVIEQRIYKFLELSHKAQKRACEDNREFNVHYKWWDYLEEGLCDEAAEAGFIGFEIMDWSADKMLFRRKWKSFDDEKLRKLLLEHEDEKVRTLAPLVCWDYGSVCFLVGDEHDDILHDMTDYVCEKANRLCRDFLAEVLVNYDELISDYSVGKSLAENEYEFYEDGKVYNG